LHFIFFVVFFMNFANDTTRVIIDRASRRTVRVREKNDERKKCAMRQKDSDDDDRTRPCQCVRDAYKRDKRKCRTDNKTRRPRSRQDHLVAPVTAMARRR